MTAIVVGGQNGWVHDDGHACGYFNTFDEFTLGDLAPRKLNIFIPREAEDKDKFPVVYMHDGAQVFWPNGDAGMTWDAAGKLQELIDAGTLTGPVIIIAIHAREDRDDEYTAGAWPAALIEREGVDPYVTWLADTLKPWVDRNYPTIPDPEFNAVMGASHGGLASFVAVTTRPETFGFGGCFSSSFWVGVDTIPDDLGPDDDLTPYLHGSIAQSTVVQIAERALLGEDTTRPGLWIDWGLKRDEGDQNAVTEDLATIRSKELVELLVAQFGYSEGVNLFMHEDKIGGHDERAWNYRFGLCVSAWLLIYCDHVNG